MSLLRSAASSQQTLSEGGDGVFQRSRKKKKKKVRAKVKKKVATSVCHRSQTTDVRFVLLNVTVFVTASCCVIRSIIIFHKTGPAIKVRYHQEAPHSSTDLHAIQIIVW